MAINLYDYKGYKLFILIPVVLLLISLYFIPKIELDSTLQGGVNIQLVTNTTQSLRNVTVAIDAVFPNSQVERSSLNGVTSLSVTILANASIVSASKTLQQFLAESSNYSNARILAVANQQILLKNPDNSTAKVALLAEQANETKALLLMNSSIVSLKGELSPIITNNTAYNSSDAVAMQKFATNLYTAASPAYKKHVLSVLNSIVPFTISNYGDITPTLAANFLTEVLDIVIVAFVLVAITVVIIFRSPVPAFAVVFGAANDIIVALGAMGAFHIPLGVVSVGGLLMLIGFSMDTDILSATRILRRSEGTPSERAMASLRTGLTMTAAAVISFSTLLAIAYIAFIPTYIEISAVVLFGLAADILTTWFANAVIIVWFKKRQEERLRR